MAKRHALEFPQSSIADRIPEDVWVWLMHRLALSPRETQILKGVCNGADQADLAAELLISPHTIHTLTSRLYAKLGVRTRAQLIAYAFMTYVADRADLHVMSPDDPPPTTS
jgi:DNA-binding CsgD family transcriptional regulator